MKKMNKKGFTLIELLTVIAILAVILLIAAPTILGVLDKARKNTFKNQVLLYVEGVKTQMALTAMGAGYAQYSIATPAASGETEVAVTALNSTVMDSEKLTGGSIFVVADASGNISYSLAGVHDANYTTPSEKTALDTALNIDNITKFTAPAAGSGD